MATQVDNQTIGRGELFFSLFKPGTQTPAGFRSLGNAPSANLSFQNQKLDHFDSRKGIKRKDKSKVIETTASISLTLDDIQLDNLALFFFGDASVVAQTSATAQTETFTDVQPALALQLGITDANPTGIRSVSNVTVKVGATTKTLGTDYAVDLDLALVTVLSGGTILADDDVIVTFDRAAKSRDRVISGTTQIEGALRYIADNPEGANFDYYMPKVSLSSDGDFALIGEEWQQLSLVGEILAATNRELVYIDGRPYTP